MTQRLVVFAQFDDAKNAEETDDSKNVEVDAVFIPVFREENVIAFLYSKLYFYENGRKRQNLVKGGTDGPRQKMFQPAKNGYDRSFKVAKRQKAKILGSNWPMPT